MECQLDANEVRCICTYEPCERKGKCFDCIRYHKNLGELPGCLFPPEVERTYDRSIAKFVEVFSSGKPRGPGGALR